MKKIIPFLFPVIMFASCSNNEVFKEYRSFDNISWDRYKILDFEVVVEKGQLLDFDLFLRHRPNYAYDHLDVNITFYTPSGATMSRDYHFKLKDDSGKWKARGLGNSLKIELPLRKEMKIGKTGIMKVRIENKMTKISTPGIMELGLIASVSN